MPSLGHTIETRLENERRASLRKERALARLEVREVGVSRITVSWPARVLSPNVSAHGARKGAARKGQREEAFWLAKQARLVAPESDRIRVHMDFYPQYERRRDEDNMQASMKGALDGLAKAMGVDDSRFKPSVTIHPADGRGVVEITVEAL